MRMSGDDFIYSRLKLLFGRGTSAAYGVRFACAVSSSVPKIFPSGSPCKDVSIKVVMRSCQLIGGKDAPAFWIGV